MAGLVAPMLAIASTGSSGRPKAYLPQLINSDDWALDTKLDGERALWDGTRLTNRKGEDISDRFPEVVAHLKPRSDMVLDGEIVALDGTFETVLVRGSNVIPSKIRQAAVDSPCTFVAFDLPMLGVNTGNHYGWLQRRLRLERLAEMRGITVTPVSYDESLWDRTREQGMEGVIAKRLTSRYQPGKRSADWIKFKHLHRVSCIVAGYLPGNGPRAHLGALVLAMLDADGNPVSVGRVGSGFTMSETHTLKARLDAGEILVAEIETTHVTSGRTLRFPVWRGVRTDVAVADCTVGQLATLPRC